jgi:hypothetical protein
MVPPLFDRSAVKGVRGIKASSFHHGATDSLCAPHTHTRAHAHTHASAHAGTHTRARTRAHAHARSMGTARLRWRGVQWSN